jgi:hypothetical protein
MKRYPKSPYLKAGGLVYLPRMFDKMRLHLAGELPEDYHALRGKGMDGRACSYLRIEYEDALSRAREGLSDEELAQWCLDNGRPLNDVDILIWNDFMTKRGCHESDPAVTELLEKFKAESGLSHRDDIKTFFEYFEADEGRDNGATGKSESS